MASLTDLNAFCNETVSFTDNRIARVKFEYAAFTDTTQVIQTNQFNPIIANSVIKIVKPDTVNLSFTVEFSDPDVSLIWGALPDGVTETVTTTVDSISYRLDGIDTVEQWDAISSPIAVLGDVGEELVYTTVWNWTDNESNPVENSITVTATVLTAYLTGEFSLTADTAIIGAVLLVSSGTMTTNISAKRDASMTVTATATIPTADTGRIRGISSNITAVATIPTVNIDIIILAEADITASATLSCTPNFTAGGASDITAVATIQSILGLPMEFTVTGSSTEFNLSALVAYSMYIDYGDGTGEPTSGVIDHTYASAGTYTVKVYGDPFTFLLGSFSNVTAIPTFGDAKLTQLAESFGSASITQLPTTLPSTLTSFERLFYNNDTISATEVAGWDTSNVTNMAEAFRSTQSTTAALDITGWNTANVTTMEGMFLSSRFNSDIGGWNTTNVTNMISMFQSNAFFNQDLSSWCVENIASEPTDFDTGATAWVLPRPNWGASCDPYFVTDYIATGYIE